ncbi:MAG: fluoride efflux transporter CrcB [Microcystis panniformis WG22]|nr:fluoride efflux transporter CrcB [Microcystis panniformis WG22]
MSDLNDVFAIVAGAVPGALSRYHITEWAKAKFGLRFPYGTFIINLTGCLAIGFFWAILPSFPFYSHAIDLMVRTGFLGAYTTFSTYSLDILILWRNQQNFLSVFFAVASIIFGLIAVKIGAAIAQVFLS